jgi:hypothetical protein
VVPPQGCIDPNKSKEHEEEKFNERHLLRTGLRILYGTDRQAIPLLIQFFPVSQPNLSRDLTNPAWIKAKGLLFLFLGLLSAALLLLERPTPKAALLLVVAVWSFCRFYYFAFYVLERYVDPAYRFSGLGSLVRHLLRNPDRKP